MICPHEKTVPLTGCCLNTNPAAGPMTVIGNTEDKPIPAVFRGMMLNKVGAKAEDGVVSKDAVFILNVTPRGNAGIDVKDDTGFVHV
jgi:hypothetical protein